MSEYRDPWKVDIARLKLVINPIAALYMSHDVIQTKKCPNCEAIDVRELLQERKLHGQKCYLHVCDICASCNTLLAIV